jgi:hypothetical protein
MSALCQKRTFLKKEKAGQDALRFQGKHSLRRATRLCVCPAWSFAVSRRDVRSAKPKSFYNRHTYGPLAVQNPIEVATLETMSPCKGDLIAFKFNRYP